jgi:hypothetical protein
MRCGPLLSRPRQTLQPDKPASRAPPARMPAQPRVHLLHTSESQSHKFSHNQVVPSSASVTVTSHRLSGRLPSAASASDSSLSASLSGPIIAASASRSSAYKAGRTSLGQSHAQAFSALRRQHPRLTGPSRRFTWTSGAVSPQGGRPRECLFKITGRQSSQWAVSCLSRRKARPSGS